MYPIFKTPSVYKFSFLLVFLSGASLESHVYGATLDHREIRKSANKSKNSNLSLRAGQGAGGSVLAPDGSKVTDVQERMTVWGKAHTQLTGISPNKKYTASLLNTPRSISVVTQEQMKLVNATSFEEAMRTVPGISFRAGDAYAVPGGNYPVIRGFGSYSNMFIDGLRDSGVTQREVFDVEEMEVLKGPGSVYGGRGGLGGQINITTKKAQLGNMVSGQIGFGTAAYKRGTIDINR